MLKEGSKAPSFTLPDDTGKLRSLSQWKGEWLLLYFYPKDNTPGCTNEACSIRDDFPQFQGLDAKVVGISADTVESHAKFKEEFSLPFPLLSDSKKEVIKEYGAWGKKKFMGREYEGIFRISYLIDPAGYIAKAYEKVKPLEHASQVIEDLKVIQHGDTKTEGKKGARS